MAGQHGHTELADTEAAESGLTLKDHLRELQALRDQAAAEGRYSSAIQAEIARGKVAGLYAPEKEKVDTNITLTWED